MTRMYFDVKQVREFLLKNGFVTTLRDPRITTSKEDIEQVDLWQHDGSSRWGIPLNLKANRLYLFDAGSTEEIQPFASASSFVSAEEWWKLATSKYKPDRVVNSTPIYNLELYYVHLLKTSETPH